MRKLPIVVLIGCASSREPGTSWTGLDEPANLVESNVEARSSSDSAVARAGTLGVALKWMLNVRQRLGDRTFDDAIRRLTLRRCGIDDRDGAKVMGARIEDIYPLEHLDEATVVGCGLIVTKDARRYVGKVVGP